MRLITLLIQFRLVSSHGYLSNPPAVFTDNTIKTSNNGFADERIDDAFRGLKWNDSPDNNVKTFTAAFKKSRFTTLKQMFDTVGVQCAPSRTDIDPVDVSMLTSMSWQNDEYKEGFINSHSGSCETWIDNSRVFNDDDCRTTYKQYPAVIPIDYSKCQGKCMFVFYWIALHEPVWQLYKQCVPIINKNTAIAAKDTPSVSPIQNQNVISFTTILNGSVCTCSFK